MATLHDKPQIIRRNPEREWIVRLRGIAGLVFDVEHDIDRLGQT